MPTRLNNVIALPQKRSSSRKTSLAWFGLVILSFIFGLTFIIWMNAIP